MRDLRNNMDMHLPVISDWDYGSSTSSIDDLPEVQIQIGLGAEQSLLHNTPQMLPNITSPSCNDGNNASDVTLVDAFLIMGIILYLKIPMIVVLVVIMAAVIKIWFF